MFAESLDAVAAWLWTFAVHGTVIVAVVAALALLARRAPSHEEPLWRYAIVAGLLTASTQVWLGPSPFAPLTFTVPTTIASSPATGSGSVAVPELGPPAPADALGLEFDGPPSGASEASGRDALAEWGRYGAGFALLFALGGLASLGRRRAKLLAWLAERREVHADHPMRGELDALRARLGFAPRVRLTASGAIASPVAFGVLRPEICVPLRALSDQGPASRTAMLAHELAHLVRRDPLWLDLANTLKALFPWQPMLALAARRLRALAEQRCDAIAARIAGPLAVAECLVEVAGWIGDGRRVAPREIPAMAVERHGLRDRIERLLGDDWREHRGPSPLGAALATLTATTLFAATLPGADVREVDDAAPVAAAPLPAATPSAAATPALAERLARLADLVVLYDAERVALSERLATLRAHAALRGEDREQAALLASVEARLAVLDRLRARIATRAAAVPNSQAVAPSVPARPVPVRPR